MSTQPDNLLKIERERLVLLNHLQELVFNFKLGGKFFFVNSVWLKQLKYEPWEALRLGFQDILQNDQIMKWRKIQQRLTHGMGYASLDFVFKTKKNEDLIVQGSLQPMSEEGDIMGIFQDVTPIRQVEKERDRFFLYSIDMLCILQYDGRFRRVNPAFHKVLGIPEEDFLRRAVTDFVHPDDQDNTLKEFAKLRRGIPSVYFESRCRHQDGSYRWLSWKAHPVAAERLIYAVARDVTEDRDTKESLEHMAYNDTLTGLYNRRGFSIAVERMQKIAYRNKMGLLLMIADIDNMKLINDHYGHQKGDAALIAAAHILQERFRESDLVARIGGDEFVAALLTDSFNQSAVIRNSLANSFADYSKRTKRRYPLSLSMGFAFTSDSTRIPIDELMERADKTMYEYKRQHSAELGNK